MPNNVPAELEDKFKRCKEQVLAKGESEEAAYAICYTSVVEGKAYKGLQWVDGVGLMQELKVGQRHSAADIALIGEIHDAAHKIQQNALGLGHVPAVTPTAHEQRVAEGNAEAAAILSKTLKQAAEAGLVVEDDALALPGSAIKALGDGKIGGYLVVFGSEKQTDLEGDYFTKDTNFGAHKTTPVYYHHGLDGTLKRAVLDDAATLKTDDVGVWVEAQLKMRDAYERFIYGQVEAGKAGWSSGTAAHLVEREQKGAAAWVKAWPLGLDASITLTPAEPRARAVPIKSLPNATELKALLQTAGDAVTAGATAGAGEQTISSEVIQMDPEMKTALDALTAATTANTEAIKALTPKPGSAVVIESSAGFAGVKAADVQKTPYKSFKDFGYGEFVKDVIAASRPGVAPAPRLIALREEREASVKAILGANETVASEGGWLTQTDHEAELIKLMHESAVYSSRVNSRTLGGAFNSVEVNGLDETSRVNGSRWGGVVGYRVAEGIAPTAANPKFRKIGLRLKDYAAAAYLTNDVIQDASMVQGEITDAMPKELAFMVDDDIQNGLGVAGPLGWMVSGALVTVSKEVGQAAATINYQNLVKMWARLTPSSKSKAVWFINTDVTPQLDSLALTVGTGALPPNYITYDAAGVMRIKGVPVIPTEFCATLGTKGDITLVDLSQYKFIDKGGVQTMMSIHVEFLSGQTVVKSVYRCDGQPVWASPLTPYKGSNTVSPFIALETRS